jgi:putative transposase
VSKRVDLAYQAFFRRVKDGETPGYPRAKGDGYDSFTYPQSGFGFHQGKLRLSKIGDVAVRLHRHIDGDIKTCTIRRINSKWFACFSVEIAPQFLPPSVEEVGIDVGLKTFSSLSNGEFIISLSIA